MVGILTRVLVQSYPRVYALVSPIMWGGCAEILSACSSLDDIILTGPQSRLIAQRHVPWMITIDLASILSEDSCPRVERNLTCRG